MDLTLARPPRMQRRPCRFPLSLAIGARPASLAMALFETVPISGSSASRVATVRSETPLTERKLRSSAWVSGSHSISAAICPVDRFVLAGEQRDDLGQAGAIGGIAGAGQALLLDGEVAGDLAHSGVQTGHFLLILARRRGGDDPPGSGVASDDLGIDSVGLLQTAHCLGKVSDRQRIDHGAGQPGLPQTEEGGLLIAAAGLHHHQFGPRLAAKRRQRRHPFAGVGHPRERPRRTGKNVEPVLRNIHSTNDLHHGNLPCLYDWKPNDCSVVRDSNADPRLRPGRTDLRGNGRQRCNAGVGGHPPQRITASIMQTVTLSRYKGARGVQLDWPPPPRSARHLPHRGRICE